MKIYKKKNKTWIGLLTLILAFLFIYYSDDIDNILQKSFAYDYSVSYDISEIPEYSGKSFIYI